MSAPFRHVGIDEAGYGPNLGPLVMTAVTAEGSSEQPPDLWADLPGTISRAGGAPDRLWVDDSKLVYKGGLGRDRLDLACVALMGTLERPRPSTFGELLAQLGSGSLAEVELNPWIETDPSWLCAGRLTHDPFAGAPWKIVDVRTVVMGPARFNELLGAAASKADVHFSAFQTLLKETWASTTENTASAVVGDKHGGRHFYLDRLSDTFPDTWIDRGPEGPQLSQYVVRQGARRLGVELRPKADSANGLVALASLVSKAVRETWMEAFNAFWRGRIPDLKPTAGYPSDATRFRIAIEPICQAQGWAPSLWWRAK